MGFRDYIGIRTLAVRAVAIGVALAAAGCGHRLIADQGQTTVKVFQSEEIYQSAVALREQIKTQKMNQAEYGLTAGLLNTAENGLAKNVDGGTKVKVISKDAVGAQIEVLEGLNNGYRGFVPKANLD